MSLDLRALAAHASIIGHSQGIKVSFDPSAATAYTDGRRIVLPVVTNLGTEDHEALIEGLVDHEAMHCKFTDFEVLNQGKFSKLVATLGNLIEDVWGEREQAKAYPGCAIAICKSMEVMIKLGWYRGPSDDPLPPSMLITNWLLHGLLGRWYKLNELLTMTDEYLARLEPMIGADLTNRLWELACQVDQVDNTADGYVLAQRLSDLITQSMPEDAQTAAEQAQRDALEQILNADEELLATSDLGVRISQALTGMGVAGPSAGNRSAGVPSDLPNPRTVGTDAALWNSRAISDARALEVRLGSKLEILLESKIEENSEHKRSGRRIDSRRLATIKVGRTDVYRHTDEQDGLNTAITILLDASGSMNYNFEGTDVGTLTDKRIISAGAVTYAAAQVFEKHSIPFAVNLFGSCTTEFKSFDQKWRIQRDKLLTDDCGGTNTFAAIQAGLMQLLTRSEDRKQIILVTDGCSNDDDAVITALKLLQKHGIQTAIVFIGYAGLDLMQLLNKEGFKYARALDGQDLAAAFFAAIENSF